MDTQAEAQPDESYHRVADLMRRYGVSRQTIFEWRRNGYLPRPKQIGPNVIGWPPEVIREWEQKRATA